MVQTVNTITPKEHVDNSVLMECAKSETSANLDTQSESVTSGKTLENVPEEIIANFVTVLK